MGGKVNNSKLKLCQKKQPSHQDHNAAAAATAAAAAAANAHNSASTAAAAAAETVESLFTRNQLVSFHSGGTAHPEGSRERRRLADHPHLAVVKLPETFALEEIRLACTWKYYHIYILM